MRLDGEMSNVDLIIQYIVMKGDEVVNKEQLALKLGKNERSVREALYTMNERGWIVCDRPDGNYLIVDRSNFDKHYEEALNNIKEQKARAMSSIIRYNRMLKALPEEYQEQFKEIIE